MSCHNLSKHARRVFVVGAMGAALAATSCKSEEKSAVPAPTAKADNKAGDNSAGDNKAGDKTGDHAGDRAGDKAAPAPAHEMDHAHGKDREKPAETKAVAAVDGSISVEVGTSGYTPGAVEAPAGKPLKIVFTRTTDKGCGSTIVFPDHDIKRDLPLNEAVTVEITPKESERISFTCGMGMYRGTIVAAK